MRRGGIGVTVAGLDKDESQPVICSRKVKIAPDCSLNAVLDNVDSFDGVVLPGGGPGAKALADSSVVGDLLKKFDNAGKLIGAVCAAPTALKAHKIGPGKRLTSYPAFKEELSSSGYQYNDEDSVVVDGNLITSRGPGTCFAFGIKLVAIIAGAEAASPLAKQMLIN